MLSDFDGVAGSQRGCTLWTLILEKHPFPSALMKVGESNSAEVVLTKVKPEPVRSYVALSK